MAEQEQNRNEPATPFKLREAKKRGQVAKSLELNSLLILLGFLLVIYVWGEKLIVHQLNIQRALFNQAQGGDFSVPHLMALFSDTSFATIQALSPLIIVLMLIAVLANLAQTGPVFTFFPLKPDLQRINPVAGFKRVFSMKLLVEALKSVIKLVLFGFIMYYAILSFIPKLIGAMNVDPRAYPVILLDDISRLIFKLCMVILFIALIDLLYTRRDFASKMRMSQREIKEEVRRREGDPQIRARIRELRREAAKRSSSLSRVPDADVLITNPTRIAVALVYKRGEMNAPEVIAKGAGELARTMRVLATKHRVPIIENKPLARTLFKKSPVGSAVPETLFENVAMVLARAYAMRQNVTPKVVRT